MNTIDASDWEAGRRKDWKRGEAFRLLYAGSISPKAQLNALQEICRVVAGYHEKGVPVEFRIHTPARFAELYRDVLGLAPKIQFLPPPEDDNIVSLFAGADVLVLPVNFDEESLNLMRFSMPTKVPAYLCSGTPVLVYGPRGLAQVEYAESEGWGCVVNERNVRTLEDAIEALMGSEELRRRLACRGREVALQNHDAAVVRPAFHKVLMEAVPKRRVGV
jgi:glycosyltransferase involved in cell wall biosynthesis